MKAVWTECQGSPAQKCSMVLGIGIFVLLQTMRLWIADFLVTQIRCDVAPPESQPTHLAGL